MKEVWIVCGGCEDGNFALVGVFSSEEEARKCQAYEEEWDTFCCSFYEVYKREVKNKFEPS